MENIPISKEVLNLKETLIKAKSLNYHITEYTLRRAIKEGALPCRIIGRTYLIAWSNFERWLFCCDSSDNQMCETQKPSGFAHLTHIYSLKYSLKITRRSQGLRNFD